MDFSGYVGLPWKLGGRDRDGVDCWGLLCVFCGEEFGVTPPLHQDRTGAFTVTREGDFAGWERLDAPEVGCGVLLRRPRSLHVAVVAEGGRFLNIEEDGMSVLAPRVAGRVDGYWRLRR